jgi:hypothetical protein
MLELLQERTCGHEMTRLALPAPADMAKLGTVTPSTTASPTIAAPTAITIGITTNPALGTLFRTLAGVALVGGMALHLMVVTIIGTMGLGVERPARSILATMIMIRLRVSLGVGKDGVLHLVVGQGAVGIARPKHWMKILKDIVLADLLDGRSEQVLLGGPISKLVELTQLRLQHSDVPMNIITHGGITDGCTELLLAELSGSLIGADQCAPCCHTMMLMKEDNIPGSITGELDQHVIDAKIRLLPCRHRSLEETLLHLPLGCRLTLSRSPDGLVLPLGLLRVEKGGEGMRGSCDGGPLPMKASLHHRLPLEVVGWIIAGELPHPWQSRLRVRP